MDRKLVVLSLLSLLLVAATLPAFARVATAEPDPVAAVTSGPAVEVALRFDEECSTCHADHEAGHPADCRDCHVTATEPPDNGHPEFRPMTDGVCITCHQKGSLP